MFGLSLSELFIIMIVALIFIKPQDLPEIARFIGRMVYRAKKLWADLKAYIKSVEGELGIDDLKHELNRGIADEKAKLEEDVTIIVDMYGNEHHVANIKEIRSDLEDEELDAEIKRLNAENAKEGVKD